MTSATDLFFCPFKSAWSDMNGVVTSAGLRLASEVMVGGPLERKQSSSNALSQYRQISCFLEVVQTSKSVWLRRGSRSEKRLTFRFEKYPIVA